jgi:pantoate--beta-alanine ligase
MIVLKLKQEVREYIRQVKANNQKVGFVATMGALHQGHLSLIDKAALENHLVVCSIFVNPLQFNNKNDFEKYPQTIDSDLKLLESKSCDMVFLPDVEEMYSNEDNTLFNFGNLDNVMEGVHRPGHFLGMAKVVKRLFDIITPDTAYFGEKDFQQLAIIRKFTNDLEIPVKVIGCPIMREADGLAMSSRNLLLSPQQRKLAPFIYATLLAAKEKVKHLSVPDIKEWVEKELSIIEGFELEYFEIADAENLLPATNWSGKTTIMGFIVVRLDSIRLIDNIVLLPKN